MFLLIFLLQLLLMKQETVKSGATPRRRKTQGNAHQDKEILRIIYLDNIMVKEKK